MWSRSLAAIAAALGVLASPAAGQVRKETPNATEIGVTPTEIHIAVIADVDNPFLPGVLADARDAVQSFAKYINGSCATKNKCLAGRKLVVDFYDSHLNANQTRNAEIQACANDLAMVGTSALTLASVDDMRNCKDQAGATTGIPDIPFFAAPIVQQCSDESFPIAPIGLRCATKDQHPQTYDSNVARGFYFTKKYGALHGIYLFSLDSRDGYNDEFVGTGGLRDIGGGRGIRSDGDFRVSALTPQSTFTPFVQAMKTKGSNYAECAQPYQCTLDLRNEAVLQGISDQVKVWDCGGRATTRSSCRAVAPTSITSTSTRAFYLSTTRGNSTPTRCSRTSYASSARTRSTASARVRGPPRWPSETR